MPSRRATPFVPARRWVLAALVLAACDAGVDPRDARIAELEAQVQALQAYRVDRPLGEPPADAWVYVDGAEWATNGQVLVRRDGPRPDPAAPHPPWRRDLTAEELRPAVRPPSPAVPLTRVDSIDHGGGAVVRLRRDPDGALVHVDAGYARALPDPSVQGQDPLGPVYALAGDGGVAAVVMPRRPPAEAPGNP